ncbi:hypothetical protein DH2020_031870 [Rehmannia glutinosa]|uniref:Protein kinase domain-containing protein n=1 Tax=Rehmannia glutinosa TaxID=99300 RepID=A0ABR0VJN7_REHGL
MGAENDDYKKKERIVLAIILVFASVAVASVLVTFSYYCYLRYKLSKRFKTHKKNSQGIHHEEKANNFPNIQVATERGLQVFTFKQLHSATGGFGKSNVIGHGALGSVYRGVLQNGRKVAVKLMDQAGKQGDARIYSREVELLGRLRSPYLLSLIGYCSESNRKLLVYEFMANGGLQEHLYPMRGNRTVSSNLNWETRLRVALEAAKVSDFGLAKLGSEKAGGHVSTRVLGTQGYVAPEYALTGHLTTKSDVYSYGVVLLELLTGRVPVDMKRPQGEAILVSWALPQLTDRDKVGQIMDPALEGQYSMKEVIQVAAIAAMCVQPEADYRPLMADVVQSLVPLVKHLRPQKAGTCSSFHATQSPKS